MTSRDPTITADEIADLLKLKPKTFLRKRGGMIEAGFPRPLPGFKTMWSRRLVDLWIATNGVAQPTDPEAPLDPIAAAREALERRIDGRAA